MALSVLCPLPNTRARKSTLDCHIDGGKGFWDEGDSGESIVYMTTRSVWLV